MEQKSKESDLLKNLTQIYEEICVMYTNADSLSNKLSDLKL